LACAQAGYDVVVHARGPETPEETAGLIRAIGRQAQVALADLANPSECETLIAAAPGPVTLLVNCASLFEDDRIESLETARWDATLATNLRAPMILAKTFAAALPTDRQGLIVNVVDQRVWRLNPQFFSYTLSKAALWTATQTLAQALAPRIRVNAIGPGPTLASVHQTPEAFAAEAAAIPLEHAADVTEMGEALAYLIAARSVTGQMIAVDGGQHLAWRTPDIADG
jgi:NAD(P)-dependent dehydrogenase (short-subunit alcohol dehydrogenase family)